MEMDDNSGFLFDNADRSSDKSPHKSGKIKLNGLHYSVSAWYRTSRKTGKKYLALKVNPVANSTVDGFPPAD